MPPYEAESSDEGEADDFTETNVLLGYASNEATSDAISHLGGYPSWLDEKSQPSGALAKCRVCNDPLSLLLELNGDLPDHFPGHERRLYIFSCRRRTCRRKEGSVRGIRGVRVAKGASSKASAKKAEIVEPKAEPKSQAKLGGSLFGVKDERSADRPTNPFSNPFSSNTNGNAVSNPFAVASKPLTGATSATQDAPSKPDEAHTTLPETFASKVRLSSPSPSPQTPRPYEPWPAQSSFPSPYPTYYLDAEYETLDTPSAPEIPANARMDIDSEGGGAGKEDKEVFESSMDQTFQKFADRVGQNAEQVLRYEFKGKPLLYSDADAVGKMLAAHSENGAASNAKISTAGSRGGAGMPRCNSCGAERVFEVQLTPHAITELEAEEVGIEGMEWGTIILGVCGRDCKPGDVADGEVGYMEEWVGVQWEEVAGKKL